MKPNLNQSILNLLQESYQEMAEESRKIMDDFKFLDSESLKYL